LFGKQEAGVEIEANWRNYMTEHLPEERGGYITVAKCATSTEAHLLKETLAAAGLAAQVADDNFAQVMANAVGSVRVMVPACLAVEAKQTIAAFRAGEFQLDEQVVRPGQESEETQAASGRRPKTYLVYSSSTRKPAVIVVKKGFSWPAFLIGPLWFLLNGMWVTFFISLGFTWLAPLAIQAVENPANPDAAAIQFFLLGAYIVIWIFIGKVANFLLGEELRRKGYQPGPPVHAGSTWEAIDAHGPAHLRGQFSR
jgi:hypothetical protein